MLSDPTIEDLMTLIDAYAKAQQHRERIMTRGAVFDAVCKLRGAVVQARHDSKGKGKKNGAKIEPKTD